LGEWEGTFVQNARFGGVDEFIGISFVFEKNLSESGTIFFVVDVQRLDFSEFGQVLVNFSGVDVGGDSGDIQIGFFEFLEFVGG